MYKISLFSKINVSVFLESTLILQVLYSDVTSSSKHEGSTTSVCQGGISKYFTDSWTGISEYWCVGFSFQNGYYMNRLCFYLYSLAFKPIRNSEGNHDGTLKLRYHQQRWQQQNQQRSVVTRTQDPEHFLEEHSFQSH